MTEKSLIDDHVSPKQCKLAVEALLKHETKRQQKLEESELLPGKEPLVWLSVTVKQMHPEKKLKPHKMYVVAQSDVPHSNANLSSVPSLTLSSTLAHPPSASLRKTLKENTKTFSKSTRFVLSHEL